MTASFEEPPGNGLFGRDISPAMWNDWKWQLKNAVSSLEGLKRFIPTAPACDERFERVISNYPLSVTPYYLSLIDFEDPDDPVRRQAFPDPQETEFFQTGEEDPLEEESDMAVPGLIHRYPDRVLLQITNMCPVLCRHCTRKREWKNGLWTRSDGELRAMIDYLEKNKNVRDVLISGGDPLVLATKRLESILQRLRAIPHLEILRIGTRAPVVLPQRIDAELVTMLKKYRPLWINTHFNHPNEITREAIEACDKILCAGIPMNNQSVLLKGVNDSASVMLRLCRELVRTGVRPYYLYQCDPVKGAEHFRTSLRKGLEIIEGLRGHTTGFAVPAFVVDAPGGGGKIPLQPDYLLSLNEDHALLRNYEGFVFRYEFARPEATDPGMGGPLWKTSSERIERRQERGIASSAKAPEPLPQTTALSNFNRKFAAALSHPSNFDRKLRTGAISP